MSRAAIMLAGVLAATVPHAGHAIDCLAYLAADEAFQPARNAYIQARERAWATYWQAEKDASDQYWKDMKWANTEKEFDRADAAERERLKQAAAKKQEDLAPARPVLVAAESKRQDAYIKAYENPAPSTHRDTTGYSRAVVLKIALTERQLCPE